MSYKNIRVEVNERVYKLLVSVQGTDEQLRGSKRSLACILLDFACDGMGIKEDERPVTEGVQDDQCLDEQDVQEEEEPKKQSVDVPDELPELEDQKERILFLMDMEGLDCDDLAEVLDVDADELAYELSHDLQEDMDFRMVSRICKVFGHKYDTWWIRRGY